jgi:2-succinyl-5-enolpyruvyl-6-hydroxy-3-cyclohexene-1-carboxylate synthase
VAHQRGASGIDGLVSGGAGVQAATLGPVALLIGDLALLHDLGGLSLLARAEGPLCVVVVNNGGGRIFDQLPVARRIDADLFERCFAAPQAVRFDLAAEAFGVPHARVETTLALGEALAAAWARRGPTLIEAVTSPGEGARLARQIWAWAETSDLGPDRPNHREGSS